MYEKNKVFVKLTWFHPVHAVHVSVTHFLMHVQEASLLSLS